MSEQDNYRKKREFLNGIALGVLYIPIYFIIFGILINIISNFFANNLPVIISVIAQWSLFLIPILFIDWTRKKRKEEMVKGFFIGLLIFILIVVGLCFGLILL